MKKTLIIGASTNPERYSYKAAERLLAHGHEIVMVANRADRLFDIDILTDIPALADIHTVTMYVSAKNQSAYYQKIIALKPKRVVFNPGTENPEFEEFLAKNGIETECACTLVLLATDSY